MASPSHHQCFIDYARKDFDFLVKDFGFSATTRGSGALESVVFTKAFLELELGWYKGEVDVSFNVLLENSVFRPYISRRFNLGEVVHHIDPHAITKTLSERPPLPRWALTPEDAECCLQYAAMLIQKFCPPILQGELSALESITWARREQDKQNEVRPAKSNGYDSGVRSAPQPTPTTRQRAVRKRRSG